MPGTEDNAEKALKLHEGGKISVTLPRGKKVTPETLPFFYTPNVASVCKKFEADPTLRRRYSVSGKTVAVVSDGTRVLGLGDMGPYGAMPVMEGKSMLFIGFTKGEVNSYPICLSTRDADEIVKSVVSIAPSFAAINLEDISSPKCFNVLGRLREELKKLPVPIPVWHDDQQGAAGVTIAALLNALKATGKTLKEAKIVVNGAGAAGLRIADYLLLFGAKGENVIVLDSKGALYSSREDMALPENKYKKALAADRTNPGEAKGGLHEIISGADALISATTPSEADRVITADLVRKMAPNAIVFLIENPSPRLALEAAKEGGAKIIANGSFPPNQINNAHIFPGVMWGVISSGAKEITDEMVVAGVKALASSVKKEEIAQGTIIPPPSVKLSRRIAKAVAKAAAKGAGA